MKIRLARRVYRPGHRACCAFILLALVFLAGVTSANAPAQESVTIPGTPVTPVESGTTSWGAMLEREALAGPKSGAPLPPPWMPVAIEVPPGFAPAPTPAPQKSGGFEPFPSPPAPALTADFEAIADPGTPPDTCGVAGPNHLMMVVNFKVRIQTKNGGNLSTVTLQNFFSPLSSSDIFDPKVVFDPLSQRFIVVACADRRSAASRIFFAVSGSDDPTQSWDVYAFAADENHAEWADYPNLGVTRDYITFSCNQFANVGDAFKGVHLWVIDKATALDGGAITSNDFILRGIGPTLVPALTYDPEVDLHFVVNALYPQGGLLRLYYVSGPPDAPQFTTTTLWPQAAPWEHDGGDAAQLGSANRIETNNGRIINAVVRNGRLWCAHQAYLPVGNPDHVGIRWWEIDVTPSSPNYGNTVQSGLIDDFASSGFYYYFPSIAVNADNEVFIGFSGSSAATYASACYTFRDSTMPPGVTAPVSIFKAGLSAYPGDRWGDYSATSVDPADGLSFYTSQEYARAGGNHGTWWGRLDRLDTRRPRLRMPAKPALDSIGLEFDEPMADNAALIATASYLFSGDGAPVTVQQVTRTAQRTVAIAISEMTQDANYTLTIPPGGPTDTSGNEVDAAFNTLSFSGIGMAPAVTVDPLRTMDPNPPLTGTVDDPEAVIRVAVGGQTNLPAVNKQDGTWLLFDDTLLDLFIGMHDVVVMAVDPAGNQGFDSTTNELIIDPFEVPGPRWAALALAAAAMIGWAGRRESRGKKE